MFDSSNAIDMYDKETYGLITSAKATVRTMQFMGLSMDKTWDAIIQIGVDNLSGIYNSLYILLIQLLSRKFTREQIGELLALSEGRYNAMVEQIEDEELVKSAEERIAKYGGWDEALKHTITEKELMDELGITEEMLASAPEPKIEGV